MRSVIALVGVVALTGGALAATATNASAAPAGPSAGLTAAAGKALREHSALVKGSARDAYQVYSSTSGANGRGVVRYTRTYDGLRVYGGDLVIRLKKDGSYEGSTVGLTKPLALSTTPRIKAAQARSAAVRAFSGTVTKVGAAELFVDASSGTGVLSYETVVEGWAKDGQTPSRLHVISDATTGAYVGSYDEIENVAGTGNSIFLGQVSVESTASASGYTLVDPTRGDGRTCDMNNGTSTCTTFTDADNVWGTGSNSDRASAAVDAAVGAATTYDYFTEVHGRNGIFGDGRGVPSRVHYGNNYVNAFWDGAQMTYGDGSGNAAPLVAIDVAGHEMSHGVTENIVPGGLTYSGESGGLNEATSDIFGNMVEFYADSAEDPGDYDIGEKIDINGDGTPLRYMYNPSLDGASHGCWATNTKNVDVHYSSGVANHFFFDLAEGTGVTPYGTSPLCGSADPVVGIGKEKAERIWFVALDQYFVSNTPYVNATTPSNSARAHTLAAAADLYGFCGTEYKAVQAAWTAVNVAGDDYCSTGNDFTVRLASSTLSITPGTSATIDATTTLVNGEAEEVTLSAGATPAGVTVTFDPAVVTAGEPTTLTVTAAETASRSVTPITITGTAPSITRTAPLTLSVESAAGCSATSTTPVAIPDNTTVTSKVTLDGCALAAPSATSTVEVHITHTYIGDLIVTLLAPDGSAYALHNRAGGSTDNINQTYTVNLAGEAPNGDWTLRVQDAASADTGSLTSWTLSL